MQHTRRDFTRLALAAIPAANAFAGQKPHSVYGGVQIGIIAPYSFKGLPNDSDSTLKNILQLGLSATELQSSMVESYAGMPAVQLARGGARGPATPAQTEARKTVHDWRLSVPMDKFKALRKMYNDAGVAIYAFKIVAAQPAFTAEEYDYAFNVVEALGASQLTMEIPLKSGAPDGSVTKLVGDIAARRKIMVGYHAHAQAKPPATMWDEALTQSKFNGINFDMGHYVANTNLSAVDFIRKHHGRITSMHLKDRKFHAGPGTPFGEGDAHVADVLRLMKKERYTFPASIEFEYPLPAGSDTMTEISKCVKFCQEALA
ncbi:MAG TPA: TIM barrel protein [Bryobacteraceae bacterium]|nr:TIM barrel protein [Bryobacteraceae bacterium]